MEKKTFVTPSAPLFTALNAAERRIVNSKGKADIDKATLNASRKEASGIAMPVMQVDAFLRRNTKKHPIVEKKRKDVKLAEELALIAAAELAFAVSSTESLTIAE